jgi:hypothetical protein
MSTIMARGAGLVAQAVLGDVSSANYGAAVTPGASAAWGSYVQLAAALPRATRAVILAVTAQIDPAAERDVAVKLAVGAAGAEVDVISGLVAHDRNNNNGHQLIGQWVLPLALPEGARVAVACTSSGTDVTVVRVTLMPLQGSFLTSPGYQQIDVLGYVSASARGTIVPGNAGTAGSYGTWTQLVAATARPYSRLWLSASGGSGTNGVVFGTSNRQVRVGIGAAGSELALVSGLQVVGPAYIQVARELLLPMGGLLPAGTRVAVSQRAETTNSVLKDLNLILLAA